ncbi:MAG: TonB-dependent receptor, partial [Alphaproteobacteria bacterium]|nr:TonB-dependent receptor [Alphaproteobacteria bacterium]
NWGIKIGEAAETRFYVAYNNISQEVPGSLSLSDALNRPESVLTGNLAGDYGRDIRSLRVSNVTSFEAGDGVTVDLGGYGQWRELFHPIFQVLDQESWNGGVFARTRVKGSLGGHRNEAMLGLNARTGTTDALQFVNLRGSRGAKTADGDQDATQIDLYGENRFFVTNEHSLVAGAQFIHAGRDYTNNLNPAASADRDYNSVSPKLGWIWDYQPGAQAFFSVSRSYEPPTFSELVQSDVTGYVPLDAQSGWTGEIGTRGSSGRWAWDLTAYHSRIENELLGYTVNPTIPAATFNAGNTVHQGLELGLDLEIGQGWLFSAKDDRLVLRQVYTLSDFNFDGDPQYGDNRIAGIPLHLYAAELRYEDARGFHLAPRLEWAPEGAWVDHANTLQSPSYITFGFGAGVEVRKGVELFLDARNLFDERYVSNASTVTDARTASTAVFYPGEGRSVFVGLKAAF